MEEFEQLKRVYYDYTTELEVCQNITNNIRNEVIDRHELTVKLALSCMIEYFNKNKIECQYTNSFRYVIRKAIEYELITNKPIWKQIGMDYEAGYTEEFDQLCYYKKVREQYIPIMGEFIEKMSELI